MILLALPARAKVKSSDFSQELLDMGLTEERIIGAVVLAALRDGIDVDVSASGDDALLKLQLGSKQATLHLKLSGGTEALYDVAGSPDLYIGLLEVAQNTCEDIWKHEQ